MQTTDVLYLYRTLPIISKFERMSDRLLDEMAICLCPYRTKEIVEQLNALQQWYEQEIDRIKRTINW